MRWIIPVLVVVPFAAPAAGYHVVSWPLEPLGDCLTGEDAPDTSGEAWGGGLGLACEGALDAPEGDREDWYRLVLHEGQRLNLHFRGEYDSDSGNFVSLQVLRPDGSEAWFILGAGFTGTRSMTVDQSGSWLFRVHGIEHPAFGDVQGRYTLAVAPT